MLQVFTAIPALRKPCRMRHGLPLYVVDTARSLCPGPEYPSRAEGHASLVRRACMLQRTEGPPALVYAGTRFTLQGSGSGNAISVAWR